MVGVGVPIDAKTAKTAGKIFKKFLIFFIIAALIGGGLMLFKNGVFGNGRLYEWAMNKKLDEYENSECLIKEYSLFHARADYTLEKLKENTSEGDYTLHCYADGGEAEVVKYTLGENVLMSWRFQKGFGELSGKTFVLRDGVIYEDGERKLAYTADNARYGELVDKLAAYLPENLCCRGNYTSADELDDPTKKLLAHIIKGETDTVLYETTEGNYYEKTAEMFIYIGITEPTEGDSVKIPEKSDYTFAE